MKRTLLLATIFAVAFSTAIAQQSYDLAARAVEGNRAVHHAVVGQGNGSVTAFLGSSWNLTDATGTVQKAIFTMQMKVHKIRHGSSPFPLFYVI